MNKGRQCHPLLVEHICIFQKKISLEYPLLRLGLEELGPELDKSGLCHF